MAASLEALGAQVAELDNRISRLEALRRGNAEPCAPEQDSFIVTMQVAALAAGYSKSGFRFCRAPADYYDRDLEYRRKVLGAPSIDHLCKTIVLVNKSCIRDDCQDPSNSKYYLLVQQYARRLNAQDVARLICGLNVRSKLSMKKFEFRLAGNAAEITGFVHNAVTPLACRTSIPVILADDIVTGLPKGSPREIWLGGGQVDLKWQVDVDEFIRVTNPIIGKVTF